MKQNGRFQNWKVIVSVSDPLVSYIEILIVLDEKKEPWGKMLTRGMSG